MFLSNRYDCPNMSGDFVNDIDSYLGRLKAVFDGLDREQIDDVITAMLRTYENGNTIYIFGNGGSAATASHFVCDFNKGVSINTEKKFDLICLNDNLPIITAIANDCGYEFIFVEQLKGKLRKGDMVFGISGSGNSKNVINAVEYARSQGNEVISLTGYDGGKLLKLSDHPIHVNVNDMQLAEDTHMMIDHLISSIIARRLGHPMC